MDEVHVLQQRRDAARRDSAARQRGDRRRPRVSLPDIGASHVDGFVSTERVFTDTTAPGLADQPTFRHATIHTEIDTRDRHGIPQRGGVYRASFGVWNDRSLNRYDFRRFDARAVHYFAVTPSGKHVVAPRAQLSTVASGRNHEVPFYFLPYVGGVDTVRSFREFRFRDENAGVFNAEFRQKAHKYVDVVPFFDVGKVAHDWQDINLTDLQRAFGVGLRAGTDERTYLRLDIAHGDGGTRVFLKFTPSF